MASNIKLTPFKHGYEFARSGNAFRFPYDHDGNNKQFKLGYDEYLRQHAGVPKGKEQPLP
jgi:hypothetical protein